MTDFERDLRERLHGLDLPPAPLALESTLREVVRGPRPFGHRRRRTLGLLAVAAALVSVGMIAAVGGHWREATIPEPTPSAPVAIVTSGPSPSPPPSPTFAASFPAEVEGLHVYTVSELEAERAAGRLSGGPIALSGYWSYPGRWHSCSILGGSPGDLELHCRDGDYGITERNEPALTRTRDQRWVGAAGPMLTPLVPDDLFVRLVVAPVNGQPYPPVPLVVIGHLDDDRAADCRKEARELCLDRFVIDRIVSYDPTVVPTPGITPPPTPFPFDSPPPPPFDAASCNPTNASEPPVFSFVGWIDSDDLDLQSQRDVGADTLYVAITRDAVPRGDWYLRPGDDQESRSMGRVVCSATEWDHGPIIFDALAGTVYYEYRDGATAPAEPGSP